MKVLVHIDQSLYFQHKLLHIILGNSDHSKYYEVPIKSRAQISV